MAQSVICTRASCTSSAGRLEAAKTPKGGPLADTTLISEFQNHAQHLNREPTALVSASDRIVDTLKRAFSMYKEGEPPAGIWITFIKIPPITTESSTRVHSARELAEECGLEDPHVFSHEIVFEWAIPKDHVLHEVSLQTLMSRGLQQDCFLQPCTMEVRRYMARKFSHQKPWEIGITLGLFAQKFGARAPLDWISRQLFHDCVRTQIWDDDVVRLRYAHDHIETVDFQYFIDLDDGVHTSLCDWWLSDTDFIFQCEEFWELEDLEEESMTSDLIEFSEIWQDFDYDGIPLQISAKETLLYEVARNKLLMKHEKKRTVIEAEAVKIGL